MASFLETVKKKALESRGGQLKKIQEEARKKRKEKG